MPFAIVTGATQGIGLAIAEHLLEAGFSLAFCARNAAKLNELASTWQAKYPAAQLMHAPFDLAKKEDALTFGQMVVAAFPQIDLLVNNAGSFLPGELGTEPDGLLEQMINTNLYSAYHLTRALLPKMKQQASGHIFNMCSVASLKAYPNGGAYSISKYALLGFSDNLREELKPHNIKVTAICPGATYTPSWAGSGVPEERIMEAGDIAKMLLSAYRLSPAANVENIILRPVKGDL